MIPRSFLLLVVLLGGGCSKARTYDFDSLLRQDGGGTAGTSAVDAGDASVVGQPCEGEADLGKLRDYCFVGVGQCERDGRYVCLDGTVQCDALAGQPQDELCGTTQDEDCDGEVDEAPDGACCVDDDCPTDQACTLPEGDVLAGGQCGAIAVDFDGGIDGGSDAGDAATDATTDSGDAELPEPDGGDAAARCEALDLQSDAQNCGVCGRACELGEICAEGECKSVCNDGTLDLDLGEQCDPGRDVYGCTGCQITGPYGSTCTMAGTVTSDGVCYNFGSTMGGSTPLVLPQTFADGSCPQVPGASWETFELIGGLCALACETAADCPPGYYCHGALHCWKR